MPRPKKPSRKTPESSVISEVTLNDLVRLYRFRQKQINVLLLKRKRLLDRLTQIDSTLKTDPFRKAIQSGLDLESLVRRRHANDRPLTAYLEACLKKHRNGMTLQELTEAVQAAGYKTKSTRFQNTVYHRLYHSKNIWRDPKTGLWKIK